MLAAKIITWIQGAAQWVGVAPQRAAHRDASGENPHLAVTTRYNELILEIVQHCEEVFIEMLAAKIPTWIQGAAQRVGVAP